MNVTKLPQPIAIAVAPALAKAERSSTSGWVIPPNVPLAV